MKQGIVVGATVAAILVAGCAGCSSKKSDQGASSSAPPPASGPQVSVDGKPQSVSGPVTCTPDGDNIKIGIGDAGDGIGAVISNADPPIVHAVGLGTVDNIMFGYSDAAPGQSGNAGAAKSGKTYAIKGTANGVDMSDAQNPKQVSKPFEMQVTCP